MNYYQTFLYVVSLQTSFESFMFTTYLFIQTLDIRPYDRHILTQWRGAITKKYLRKMQQIKVHWNNKIYEYLTHFYLSFFKYIFLVANRVIWQKELIEKMHSGRGPTEFSKNLRLIVDENIEILLHSVCSILLKTFASFLHRTNMCLSLPVV